MSLSRIQRLRAVRTLVDAGIRAGVGVAPILPGLSDKPELLADVVRASRDHGATHVWANVLYLRPGTRELFLDKLAGVWPELLPTYERLYAGKAYLPDKQTGPIRGAIRHLANRFEVGDRRTVRLEVRPADPPPAQQLALLLSTDAESRDAESRDAESRLTAPVDLGPLPRAA